MAKRPTGTPPTWATNDDYATGGSIGDPTKINPTGGYKADGYKPNFRVSAEVANWLEWAQNQWLGYLDGIEIRNFPIVGTIDGVGAEPLAVTYDTAQCVYLGTVNASGRQQKSIDGGRSFQDENMSLTGGRLRDIYATRGGPTNQRALIVTEGDGAGIDPTVHRYVNGVITDSYNFLTLFDAAALWRVITAGTLGTKWIVTGIDGDDVGFIAVSTDATGGTFTSITIPVIAGYFDQTINLISTAIPPATGRVVACAANSGAGHVVRVYWSDDLATWTGVDISAPALHDAKGLTYSAEEGVWMILDGDGKVAISSDGVTWSQTGTIAPATYDFVFDSLGCMGSWFVVGLKLQGTQRSILLVSKDLGATWEPLPAPFASDGTADFFEIKRVQTLQDGSVAVLGFKSGAPAAGAIGFSLRLI